ncbi:RNA helicase, partial [Kitasatospora sp. NPDC059795]
FGDRPQGGFNRDDRGGRPFARRDDHRSGGRPQGGFNRDDRGGRSFGDRPQGGFNRDDRGGDRGGFNGGDRKPRWKN